MKIGYLCSDIEIPLLGGEGCSIHIRDFTDALVDAGHDVFILCADVGDDVGVTTKARIYPIEPREADAVAWSQINQEPTIRNNNMERDLRSILFNAWLESEGAAIIEREQPDLLYERYALFGWAGAELARRFGIPFILEVNAPLCQEQEGYDKFTLTRTAAVMEAEVFRRADAVIAVSQVLKEWIVSLGAEEDRVHVFPNGVVDSLFRSQVTGQSVRSTYGLDGKRVVGFVGSFQPWQDVEGLMKAFARLYAKDKELRLLLVGNGPEREALEETAYWLRLTSSVIFTGHIPHERIPEYIAAMDVAVAPFQFLRDHQYSSPLKLFEYMAAGKPTVAAALGQVADIIDHGRTGWLYPPGDEEELTKGLEILLDRPAQAAAMGEAARSSILSEYTWKAITEKIVALGESLRQRSASPGIVSPDGVLER